MWIVRNKLRATIKIEGTDIEIGPEAEVDLDLHGRDVVDEMLPLAVAFEEGYLENVFKESTEVPKSAAMNFTPGMTSEEMTTQLAEFKKSILEELKQSLPQPVAKEAPAETETMVSALLGEKIGAVQEELRAGVKGVLESLEAMQSRLSVEKQRIVSNPNLSKAEIRARIAFIEETERNIQTNFEKVGHEIEGAGGQSDVMNQADLLSDLGLE